MNVVADFFHIIELDDLDGSKVVKFPTMRVGESGKMETGDIEQGKAVQTDQNEAFVQSRVHPGGKCLEQNFEGRGSPVSDITDDPTAVLKNSSSTTSSTGSSPATAVSIVPRFFALDVDIVHKEVGEIDSAVRIDPKDLSHDMIELRESMKEFNEIFIIYTD